MWEESKSEDLGWFDLGNQVNVVSNNKFKRNKFWWKDNEFYYVHTDLANLQNIQIENSNKQMDKLVWSREMFGWYVDLGTNTL